MIRFLPHSFLLNWQTRDSGYTIQHTAAQATPHQRHSSAVRALLRQSFVRRRVPPAAAPEFATYEMRNPKPGKGLGYFEA